MKAGSRVVYVNSSDNESEATVNEVTGTGESGYKVLSLTPDGDSKVRENVPNERDAGAGKAFWREIVTEPSITVPIEPPSPPVLLTVEFASEAARDAALAAGLVDADFDDYEASGASGRYTKADVDGIADG